MNQLKYQFQVTQWHKKWGLAALPSDFNTTQKKYPVIIFNHGVGETGTTEADLNRLLGNGLPYVISQSTDMNFVNPITGLSHEFICIAIQHESWSPPVEQSFYAVNNDPLIKDRISAVFVTGLSAGGQQTMMSVLTSAEISNQITGIVPMSSAGWDKTKIGLVGAKVKAWCFHGKQDPTCGYTITSEFHDALNNIAPGKSKWTELPVNHGNWNSIYAKSFKENGMNIYEWMLSLLTAGPVTPTPPPVPKVVIELFEDGTWKTKN